MIQITIARVAATALIALVVYVASRSSNDNPTLTPPIQSSQSTRSLRRNQLNKPQQWTNTEIIQDVKNNPRSWRIDEIITEYDGYSGEAKRELALIHYSVEIDWQGEVIGSLDTQPVYLSKRFSSGEITEIKRFLGICESGEVIQSNVPVSPRERDYLQEEVEIFISADGTNLEIVGLNGLSVGKGRWEEEAKSDVEYFLDDKTEVGKGKTLYLRGKFCRLLEIEIVPYERTVKSLFRKRHGISFRVKDCSPEQKEIIKRNNGLEIDFLRNKAMIRKEKKSFFQLKLPEKFINTEIKDNLARVNANADVKATGRLIGKENWN